MTDATEYTTVDPERFAILDEAKALRDEIGRLREALEKAAKIALDHGHFCETEAHNGGHPSLYERAEGAKYIAAKIQQLVRES